jgi:hypothetical protein
MFRGPRRSSFTLHDNEMTERPFLPSKEDSRRFCVAIGIVGWVLAIIEFVSPRTVTPTGRWSWLTAPIYEAFGAYGLAILWALGGAFLVLVSMKRGS